MSDALRGIIPTLGRYHGTGAVITDPPELAGRTVVAVDGWPCLADTGGNTACGLVRGHKGYHWRCRHEFIEQAGPWAVVQEAGQ